MLNKFHWAPLVCALLCHPELQAQYYFYNQTRYDSDIVGELGIQFGGMNCLTDLGGGSGIGKRFIKDLNLGNTKPCMGAYGLIMYRNAVGIKLESSFGNIAAFDSVLKPVASTTHGRYERGLSFRSQVMDFQIGIEIHPLYFKVYDEDAPRLSPYFFFGIGIFSFNPETELKGHWYLLQPLHTEGQGFSELSGRRPYELQQINFPFAAGLRYEISSVVNTRLEINYRILKTDYLDDVSKTYIDPALFYRYLPPQLAFIAVQLADRQSERVQLHVTSPGQQRGNPKNKDSFFSIQMKIGIILGRTLK